MTIEKCACEKLGSMVDVCDLHKRIAELERKNEIIFSVLYNIANACECQNCDTVCEKDYIQICSEHKARIALSEVGER